jgi:hypothetical protein
MQLILAIDSDPRRSEQLAALVRSRLQVDLVQATSAGEGLHALGDRVPDLILTAPLLSPFDDGVLDEYLRELGTAATHVQTVRIPVLGATPKKKSAAKRLFSLGRKPQTSSASPDGCDPTVFADEIALYLTRSEEQRSASARATADRSAVAKATADRFASAKAKAEPIWTPEPELVYEQATPEPLFVEPVVHVYEAPAVVVVEATPDVIEDVVEVEAAVEEFEELSAPAIEPAPVVAITAEPETVATPESTATGRSSTFDAALAAIRAAWVKPEGKVPRANPPIGPVSGGPKPLGTAPAEIDLTTAIDALEHVDGIVPADEDESSPDTPKTPPARRKTDKPKKRPEKGAGRKTSGADGQSGPDEWGVFDPNECDFAALVNKLDEVTESDEVSVRATTIVR